MGMFAETAVVDYYVFIICRPKKQTYVFRFSKQMEVCRFRFPFAANKRKSAVSVFHLHQQMDL
jgi:hypothetical protein